MLKLRPYYLQSMLITIFTLILFCSPAILEARSLEIVKVDIYAEILPDGNMRIKEQRTVNFNGEFRGADLKFKLRGVSGYDRFTVREGDQYYSLVRSFPTTEPNTYTVRKTQSYYIIDWSFYALNEQRTFTLEYIVEGAVLAHTDVAELYYQFIGDEWEFPTRHAKITLSLPPGAEKNEIQAWGHGPLHGIVNIDSSRQVSWEVSPLPKKNFLEGRVVFPLSLIPNVTNKSGREGLRTILAEEAGFSRKANFQRALIDYQWHGAVFSGLITILFLALAWIRALNKSNAYKGKYFRDLPAHFPPAVTGYLLNKKKIKSSYFSAGILDLARRGHILIEGADERGGDRNRKNDFRLVKREEANPDASLDVIVMDFLFETVYNEFSGEDEPEKMGRKKEITFKQIDEFAAKKPWTFSSFYYAWANEITNLGEKENFFMEKSIIIFRNIFTAVFCLLAITLVFWLGIIVLPLAMILSATATYFFFPRYQYSAYGADQRSKWIALRRFLLHFSKIKKAAVPSLAIWEHYLVYATVIGISRQVATQLTLLYPKTGSETLQTQGLLSAFTSSEGSFSGYDFNVIAGSLNKSLDQAYRGSAGGVKDSLRSMVGNISSSSGSSSSGSGFGGGFSGGGGGGGGGGGSFR